jgi:hypothetical protein
MRIENTPRVSSSARGETVRTEGPLVDSATGEQRGDAFTLRRLGHMSHHVRTPLPRPPPGRHYQGWLADPADATRHFPTQRLERRDSGDYTVTYSRHDGDAPGFDLVWVTLETNDPPELPGSVVLSGILL